MTKHSIQVRGQDQTRHVNILEESVSHNQSVLINLIDKYCENPYWIISHNWIYDAMKSVKKKPRPDACMHATGAWSSDMVGDARGPTFRYENRKLPEE